MNCQNSTSIDQRTSIQDHPDGFWEDIQLLPNNQEDAAKVPQLIPHPDYSVLVASIVGRSVRLTLARESLESRLLVVDHLRSHKNHLRSVLSCIVENHRSPSSKKC